ncbi:MAG: hypothetical protein NPIRA02_25700 [Nitrospirales bacterium]|nr:MAG: hypothetical protein NPIRA02_25700 [Nitrospirales bacterium]
MATLVPPGGGGGGGGPGGGGGGGGEVDPPVTPEASFEGALSLPAKSIAVAMNVYRVLSDSPEIVLVGDEGFDGNPEKTGEP